MKTRKEMMESQWAKWMGYIYDYLPTKYEASKREWAIRRFVWNFKDGKQSLAAAKVVAQKMRKQFGKECADIVFACIPASSETKTESRYKAFAAEVCRLAGCANAYEAIHVSGERLAIHEWKNRKKLESTHVISFDAESFSGKKVLVFDDIVTNGYSYARFACALENLGAIVVGGLFLARTINL